jgi:hypothetical protein
VTGQREHEARVEIGQLWAREGVRFAKRITKVGRVWVYFRWTSPILRDSRIRLDELVETHKRIGAS